MELGNLEQTTTPNTTVLKGFIQVTTRIGSFFCREAEIPENSRFVKLVGPMIMSLQVIEDPKTKHPQRLWNKFRMIERHILIDAILNIDVLAPTDLDKEIKEIYEQFSGIALV